MPEGGAVMARLARILGVLAAAALAACAATAGAQPGGAAQPPFEMRGGRVHFSGWDDGDATAPAELLSIPAADFEKPAYVYRERVIFESGSVKTKSFRVPDRATTISVIARGLPESDIFPRLRVVIAADGVGSHTVCEGYLQSLSLARLSGAIPPEFRGREARVSVEMLNPSALNDHRAVWLARVVIE